ncbi:hypothetical protein ECML606-1_000079 [Escherichia phage ECML-606-1]|nr:hypothetical protein ECML606-1_000079 [Escherichia phage ECML-606-1]
MIKITGAEVREARIAAGMTQQAMADLLGHTLRNYQRKEEGRRDPAGSGEMLSTIMPGEFYFMQMLSIGTLPAITKTVNAARALLKHTADLARDPSANPRFVTVVNNMEQALAELDHSKQTR